jgi:hypothetical protein
MPKTNKTKQRSGQVPRVYTYPTSANWTDNNEPFNYQTHQYQTGVYFITNNTPSSPRNMTPLGMCKFAKQLEKLLKENAITNLVFGEDISVSADTNGLWQRKTQ